MSNDWYHGTIGGNGSASYLTNTLSVDESQFENSTWSVNPIHPVSHDSRSLYPYIITTLKLPWIFWVKLNYCWLFVWLTEEVRLSHLEELSMSHANMKETKKIFRPCWRCRIRTCLCVKYFFKTMKVDQKTDMALSFASLSRHLRKSDLWNMRSKMELF